jgi:hypothetical protein
MLKQFVLRLSFGADAANNGFAQRWGNSFVGLKAYADVQKTIAAWIGCKQGTVNIRQKTLCGLLELGIAFDLFVGQ